MLPKIVVDKADIKDYVSNFKDNRVIVETAGFVPLEVRLKKFEEAGIKAQFHASEFTASDLRELYLSPNTEIYPCDDLETIEEKLALRQSLVSSKLGDYVERSETESPSQMIETKESEVKEESPKVE